LDWVEADQSQILDQGVQISIEQIYRNNNGIQNGDLNGKEINCWLSVQLPNQEYPEALVKKGRQSSKSFVNMMAMAYIFGISKSSKPDTWKT